MNANYDPEVDALTISWSDAPIDESESISPGVILDYDQQGNIVGIEILNASQKIENFSNIKNIRQAKENDNEEIPWEQTKIAIL